MINILNEHIIDESHKFEIREGYFLTDPENGGVHFGAITLRFNGKRAFIELYDPDEGHIGSLVYSSGAIALARIETHVQRAVEECSNKYESRINELTAQNEALQQTIAVFKDVVNQDLQVSKENMKRIELAVRDGFGQYVKKLTELEQAAERATNARKELEQFKKELEKDRILDTYGFVYLFHEVGTNCYKIGMSKNPDKRLSGLKTSHSAEIVKIWDIETSDMATLEVELHNKFREKRIRGEWFNLSHEDVDYIKSL